MSVEAELAWLKFVMQMLRESAVIDVARAAA
jgi:hypothetical protein